MKHATSEGSLLGSVRVQVRVQVRVRVRVRVPAFSGRFVLHERLS